MEWLLSGVLQAPEFLYQFARPTSGETLGQVLPLSGYEMASRLSYFLWDSTPDDKLYAAAEANELVDATALSKHLNDMVADARFLRSVTGFYTDLAGDSRLRRARARRRVFHERRGHRALDVAAHDGDGTLQERLSEHLEPVLG